MKATDVQRSSLWLTWLAVLLIALLPGVAAAQDGKMKVVYHVDFPDATRYSATLTSVNNLINDVEQELREYDVQIVFVGYGIRFVTDNKLEDTPYAETEKLAERRAELKGRLQTLHDIRNVKLMLCDKTRGEIGLPESELYEGVELVPSGVSYIADLQADGYAYLKIQ